MVQGKVQRVPALLLALLVATLFALALAGCGDQSSSSSASSSEASQEATDSSATSSEVAIPDELADVAAATKSIATNADAAKAEDLSSLPSADNADAVERAASEIDTGIEDESKAPSGQTLVYTGGIQILVPSTWNYRVENNGWDLESRSGQLWGGIYAYARQSSNTYDVEAMAASIPQMLNENGFTNIRVIEYNNCYSTNGTLCSAYIHCVGQKDGYTFMYYYEYILSKNYINFMYLSGEASNFSANISELQGITNSLAFNEGEMI